MQKKTWTIVKQDEIPSGYDPARYESEQAYATASDGTKVPMPHMLVTTGLNDPRVAYWEPAKFVAKLCELKTDNNTLILRTNFDAGHAGASGRYDFLKEVASDFAFLIDKIGTGE